MSAHEDPIRGAAALGRFAEENDADVRGLEPPGFGRWLERQLARWRRQPDLRQRSRIRDLRRANPRVARLEAELREATGRDERSACFARLEQVEKALRDTAKAVSGLRGALAEAEPEKAISLRRKLDGFVAERERLRREQAELERASPERREARRVREELERLRREVGLDREEARLRALLEERGQRSGRSGAAFEVQALELTRRHLVPELAHAVGLADGRVHVLTRVTLGAARVELDQVVVRAPAHAAPVEVLGVVEVKRNVNDVARGFRLRQENLAWLTGAETGYDAQRYRTRRYTTGRFDRGAVHRQDGVDYVFTTESFRRFAAEPCTGAPLDGLCFVTRAGPLWGLDSAALGRVAFRVATDEAWQPDDEAYLGRLLQWCRSLAAELEAPDVVRRYAAAGAAAERFLIVPYAASQPQT
jgi:hypothetical protein